MVRCRKAKEDSGRKCRILMCVRLDVDEESRQLYDFVDILRVNPMKDRLICISRTQIRGVQLALI